MATDNSSPAGYRFGPFELTSDPLRLLGMLTAAAPEVVTRTQLRAALWPDGTVVAFEVGLNSAVRRLRAALGDKAASQPYIGTVAGQGYRFIASLERPLAPEPPAGRARRWPWAAALVLAGLGTLGWVALRVPPPPATVPGSTS